LNLPADFCFLEIGGKMTENNFKAKYVEAIGFDPDKGKAAENAAAEPAFTPTDQHKAALNRAHEMRKFEIENYWKRATYIWAFQAVAFAILGFVFKDGKVAEPALLLVPAALGALTALAGWMTAKGSKFWQENWEAHVDMLEGPIEGRLTQVVMAKKEDVYSVSATNEALLLVLAWAWSLLLVGAWLWLLTRTNIGAGLVTVWAWLNADAARMQALGASVLVLLVFGAGSYIRYKANRGYRGIKEYKYRVAGWKRIDKKEPFQAIYWREPPQGWSQSGPSS
jgi:hypothetical protein